MKTPLASPVGSFVSTQRALSRRGFLRGAGIALSLNNAPPAFLDGAAGRASFVFTPDDAIADGSYLLDGSSMPGGRRYLRHDPGGNLVGEVLDATGLAGGKLQNCCGPGVLGEFRVLYLV